MTTSGTTTFSQNRNQLISSALRKVSAFQSGETPDQQSVQDASDALNTMVKHWQATGIHIWRTAEATLFPVIGQVRYELGSNSPDHSTYLEAYTELASDAALGAGNLVLDSTSGMHHLDTLGVQLDDGTFQWTQLNSDPQGNVVALTDALTDSASAGNRVVFYTTQLVRPLKIISARRYNFASGIDVPMQEMDRIEYQELPNKTSTGKFNSYYYDRRGGSNTTGLLYLWQAPADVEDAVKLTVARPIEDFTVAGDDADLPQEWIRALEWGLADEIADEYDVPEPKRTRIERRAAQFLNEANWWEKELVSIEFVPDMRR